MPAEGLSWEETRAQREQGTVGLAPKLLDRHGQPRGPHGGLLQLQRRKTPHSTTGCTPAVLMFKRPPRDCIPVGSSWKPDELDPEETHEKRLKTNQKASAWRRTQCSDMCMGDIDVVRDRYPGWKFRTTYEPTCHLEWVLVQDSGGHERDTAVGAEDADDADDHRMETSETPRNDRYTGKSPEPVPDAEPLPDQGGSCQRYHLRPNPIPSYRLRDFVC
ncbi:hypothetical protein NDU88_001009 [Pleurodeles waltl]|uniref:Uncharacterized protein n=1 Tax=Pleurodeles waltl TaxID=8319 RepID=A0AAV7L888_PLEWA|nr:hypothetical protein NDU88_001009 [Pleurodeles waltl]